MFNAGIKNEGGEEPFLHFPVHSAGIFFAILATCQGGGGVFGPGGWSGQGAGPPTTCLNTEGFPETPPGSQEKNVWRLKTTR